MRAPWARRPADGRRRALLVVENMSVPGDARVWPEARTLAAAGWEVDVISPRGRVADEAPYEERDGVRIHRYPARWATGGLGSYAVEYASALWHIGRLARRLSREAPFAVAHAANPPDLLLLALLPLRRHGTRLIFDQHDLVPELFLSRFGAGGKVVYRTTRLVERVAYRLSDVVISANESYRTVALGRGRREPRDVYVVRNGPDPERLRRTPAEPALRRNGEHLIVYVGVMGPQDGVDHALRALAGLRRARSDWRAVFVGDGDARPEMERLAGELGLDGAVEFTGFLPRDRFLPILSAADVSLAPEPRTPVNELSTMVKIAEYMALACPVVAYDLHESRVTAGPAAVYARPNDPEDLARCIDELLADPLRRRRMGRDGRRRVEDRLAWEHSVPELLAAYGRALELGGQANRS